MSEKYLNLFLSKREYNQTIIYLARTQIFGLSFFYFITIGLLVVLCLIRRKFRPYPHHNKDSIIMVISDPGHFNQSQTGSCF